MQKGVRMLRDERLTVQVLPEHKEALGRIAEREDTSSSAIVRRLIRAEAERRGLWPAPVTPAPKGAKEGRPA